MPNLKRGKELLDDVVKICEEITKFCDETNNISMKSKIQTRLAEVYYIHEHYAKALEICNKVIFDLKRYEDNLGLIQLLLLESKIHYVTNGISKSKAALTSVKTLVTKVYVEPKLQANIDMQAGILAAHEKILIWHIHTFSKPLMFIISQIKKEEIKDYVLFNI